jgi:hypothetical protein
MRYCADDSPYFGKVRDEPAKVQGVSQSCDAFATGPARSVVNFFRDMQNFLT